LIVVGLVPFGLMNPALNSSVIGYDGGHAARETVLVFDDGTRGRGNGRAVPSRPPSLSELAVEPPRSGD
jgi:hypothetical protein